jgi:hypothetical protein
MLTLTGRMKSTWPSSRRREVETTRRTDGRPSVRRPDNLSPLIYTCPTAADRADAGIAELARLLPAGRQADART